MTRIGFIGLGIMGNPMSKNLVKAGHEVTVWNRTASRMDDAVASGAKPADSAKKAALGKEIIITIVTDSAAVEEVILGTSGVIEGASPGSVVVDMSTIAPSVTRRIAAELKSKAVQMMDAPISGGDTGARSGTLSIMVGGEKAVFDRCLPVFQAMGKRITYCGESGMGQVTKLVNQIVGLGTLAAMCEGLLFAARAGGDPDAVLSALSGGAANSWMIENQGPRIFKGDFEPGFMIDLAQKDLGLILDAAAEMDLPLFTTPLISQIFRSAKRAGFGREGIQAYVKALEALSGVEVRA